MQSYTSLVEVKYSDHCYSIYYRKIYRKVAKNKRVKFNLIHLTLLKEQLGKCHVNLRVNKYDLACKSFYFLSLLYILTYYFCNQ